MDANGLIKGIEEFYGSILPRAYVSVTWTEDTITNAFQWAEFCEQVYNTYKENDCKGKLDELIHSLAVNFKNTNQEICFEDLKHSPNLLAEALFENSSVENNLIESVLLKIRNNKQSCEVKVYELDSLCVELLEALKPIKILNSDRSFYSEVKATIYLNALKTAVDQMTSEDEVETYLSGCLEKFCESTDKMVELLDVLMVNSIEAELPIKDVQEFATNWTMYKILSDKNCPLALFIWKCPSKLRMISLSSNDFLSFYLDFLTKCSSSLTSVFSDDEIEWIQRSSDVGMLSFEDILNHFRSLLGTDDDVCEITKKHIMNLLNSHPEMEIWKEIFSRVT